MWSHHSPCFHGIASDVIPWVQAALSIDACLNRSSASPSEISRPYRGVNIR
jgi:hypothetical protein